MILPLELLDLFDFGRLYILNVATESNLQNITLKTLSEKQSQRNLILQCLIKQADPQIRFIPLE